MTRPRTSYGDLEAIAAKPAAQRTYAENLAMASMRETAQLVVEQIRRAPSWARSHQLEEDVEQALTEAFERGKYVTAEALATSFQRGRDAAAKYSTGQLVEPGGSGIALDKEDT